MSAAAPTPAPQGWPSGGAGALLLAAVAPAIVVAALGQSASLFLWAFPVTAGHALLIGLPVFALAYRRGWVNALTSIGGAFIIGAVPVGILAWPLHPGNGASSWSNGTAVVIDGVPTAAGWLSYASLVGACGVLGALGGLVCWSVLRLRGTLSRLSSARP